MKTCNRRTREIFLSYRRADVWAQGRMSGFGGVTMRETSAVSQENGQDDKMGNLDTEDGE